MRSHPYEPPLSLPPLLDDLADELSSMLPNQQYYHSRRRSSTSDIPLSELDPDTSRLLAPAPTRRRQHHHHVRVQGRLALVRSVSSANLHSPVNPGGSTSPGSAVPPVPRFDLAVGSTVKLRKAGNSKGRTQGRRLSLDDGGVRDRPDSDTETDGERQRETVVRDRQLRGYGIGGAGNIRRPTEVVQFSTSKRMGSMLLFSNVAPSSPTSLTSPTSPGKRRWNLREMFGLDKKGKGEQVRERE